MKPVSGESAPQASMSRSESSRDVRRTDSSDSTSRGLSPVQSTSSPPCGRMRWDSLTTLTAPCSPPWVGSRAPLPPPGSSLPRKCARMCHGSCRGCRGLRRFRADALPALSRLSRAHPGRNDAELLETRDDDAGALSGLVLLRVDDELRALRRLVRVVHAREALDLAGKGLRVEA